MLRVTELGPGYFEMDLGNGPMNPEVAASVKAAFREAPIMPGVVPTFGREAIRPDSKSVQITSVNKAVP